MVKLSTSLTDEKAAEIGQQQYFDTLKHLTTLSSGSILILVTFLDKLFDKPEWTWLIGLAFILFVICMVFSVMLMFFHSGTVEEHLGLLSNTGIGCYILMIGVAGWSFVLGMISLVVFAMKNFY